MTEAGPKQSRMQERREAERAAKRAEQRRNRLMLVGGGVAFVALAVVVALLSTSESDNRVGVEDIAGSPEIEGAALSVAPEDSAQDPDAGAPAPVVRGADYGGDPVSIGEAGTPQMIMFMASWCQACQRELPEVVDWLDDGRLPEGVELVSVSTSLDETRPIWPPQDWFDAEGYTGPILVDDAGSSVAQAYGLRATPYWVGLDAEGEVVARITGMIGAEELDALAAAVDAG